MLPIKSRRFFYIFIHSKYEGPKIITFLGNPEVGKKQLVSKKRARGKKRERRAKVSVNNGWCCLSLYLVPLRKTCAISS